MKKIVILLMLFLFSFSLFADERECRDDPSVSKDVKHILFQNKISDLQYKYCEYMKNNTDAPFFEGKQTIIFKFNNQLYHYSNDVAGIGFFGGKVFFSELGIFGLVDSTTGNEPITISYLTIIDNELVLLGKITFDQKMGNIIGEPNIENKNIKANNFVQKILQSNNKAILDNHPLNIYEGLLFILLDDIKQNISINDFNHLSYNLLKYPDLINFYRQKVFFNNKSLCTYDNDLIEMEAFGCQIGNERLSICYNYFDKGNLVYRYGNKDKIELELSKKINSIDLINDTFIFENGQWEYQVETKLPEAGIVIKNKGQQVSSLKCLNNTVEPLILNPIWQ